MKRFMFSLTIIAGFATSVFAIDDDFIRRNIISETAQMQTGAIIELYVDRSNKCSEVMDGSISQFCLERVFIEEVLHKRGFCQSIIPINYGSWRPCLVKGSFSNNGLFEPRDF